MLWWQLGAGGTHHQENRWELIEWVGRARNRPPYITPPNATQPYI